ncbi:PorP/SprF family type IX secretion system membrane protein [Ekhidna sp. MALMAid0563]|uniref:PorP/SprF family type IX secretion system membrane protein n=1 Tax=Ekhidna sp. MALMAid0563 TaxID=3143937 RepID=UPI0032DF7917
MKRIATILFLISSMLLNGQEAQFSQYYAASLYLNPGFSGIYNDASIHMNHKRQLQSVDVINELTQVSFIFPIKPNGPYERSIGGAGIMAFNEKSGFRGVYERSSIFANYAHNIKFGLLSAYLVSIGVQVGYELRKLDFSNLSWGSQYNPFFGYDNTLPIPVTEFNDQQNNIVVNAGIMYYFNPERNYLLHTYSGFLGISATNLNRPNTSFTTDVESEAPMLFKYNGGIEFKFDKYFIMPSLLYLNLRNNHQFNAGLNVAYAPGSGRYRAKGSQLLFGVWYRLRDSFILMGGVKMQSLIVRVSYDMNSTLFDPNRDIDLAQNSMEISIQYSFSKNANARRASNPLF